MPEEFTPQNAALILLDYQVGALRLVRTTDVDVVRKMAVTLARAARLLDLPVVLTSNLEEGLYGPIVPEIEEVLSNEHEYRVARKGVVNAWSDLNFRVAVEATGRRNLIMAGATTDACLAFSATTAVRAGYCVQAVVDASGAPFALSEELARRRMAGAGVVLTSTYTLLAELAGDWSGPPGSDLHDLLFAEAFPQVRRPRRQPLVKRYAPKGNRSAG